MMIFLIVMAIVITWIIVIYNNIKRYGFKVKESFSGIDIALSKRYVTIKQMYETVKGAAKYEKEVLEFVTKLRNPDNINTIKEKEINNDNMTKALEKFNFLIENYPDLKVNKNFMKLQEAIIDVEDNLSASRRIYNSNVSRYNSLISVFPNSIIAGIIKVKEEQYFSIENINEKENVKIEY